MGNSQYEIDSWQSGEAHIYAVMAMRLYPRGAGLGRVRGDAWLGCSWKRIRSQGR